MFRILLVLATIFTPINGPLEYAGEFPPLVDMPAIATEPAVRIDPPAPPIAPPIPQFSDDSRNGRCIGAEGLLLTWSPGWSVERMSRIMYRESRCQPQVRNPSGSTGLLQIMPSNCPYIAKHLGESCTVAKLKEPTFNVRAAAVLFDYDGYGPWAL